ncbi:hypothetical protein PYCC9005_005426 [Savitreella phatthalungensis]
MTKTVPFSQYLLTRIKQLGIRDIFGVPGDFNLHFLDAIEDDKDLTWRGSTNELNGAYAADGYSRVNGAAMFVSTCGVGELSALNALAGSYAEQVPVIHLVGVPSTQATRAGKILHHTLGPNHSPTCFPDMWKSCTVAQVNVHDRTTAEELDSALALSMRRNQPIYISLPQDLVNQLQFPAQNLDKPLDLDQPDNWDALEEIVIDHIVGLLKNSKSPIILCDAGGNRDNILGEVDALVRSLPEVPYFVSAMGKGSVSEHLPNYAGVYAGKLSLASVAEAFYSADMVLFVGHIPTDLNTGMFSLDTTHQKVVELHAAYTLVRGGKFEQVGMKRLLPKLVKAINHQQTTDLPIKSAVKVPKGLSLPDPQPSKDGQGKLSYPFFWRSIEKFLGEGDVLCAEPGTCGFGVLDLKLPARASIVVQYLWASIGFGTAALVGASVANKTRTSTQTPGGRVIGFLGDGSFQMTCQELSTLVRNKLDATIFLINNNGYTVEKFLHGARRDYNQINTAWRYTETLRFLGADSHDRTSELDASSSSAAAADEYHTSTYSIHTESQLTCLLSNPRFLSVSGVKFVEIHLPEFDGGRLLTSLAKSAGRWDDAEGEPIDYDELGKPYAAAS